VAVNISVLGALTVRVNGAPIDLGTEKQRALFTSLVLRSPHVVSRDRIVEDLWGDDVPASADSTLAGYVSNLRKAFRNAGTDPGAVIVTQRPGYRLGGRNRPPTGDWATTTGVRWCRLCPS